MQQPPSSRNSCAYFLHHLLQINALFHKREHETKHTFYLKELKHLSKLHSPQILKLNMYNVTVSIVITSII